MNYLLTSQETPRLTFRLLDKSDFDTWIDLFKVENIAKFFDMDTNLSPHQMCEIWFEKSMKRYKNKNGGMNVMIDKKTNRFIGQCGLLVQTINTEKRLEIGYSILPEFWSYGYATEVAQKCKDYAFENNFADSLISMIHIDNIGSEKVAIKNGMSLEKTIGDFNIFSIHKTNWKK